MLGLLLFLYTSVVQGELFCTKKKESLVGACGDTVSLPCSFSLEEFPFTNLEMVWQMRRSRYVAVVHHEDMKNLPNLQQDSKFRNRTTVIDGWPQSRNISLTLTNISGTDHGVYTCEIFTLIPYSRKICAEIQLAVQTDAVGFHQGISLTAAVGESVYLPCFSKLGCGNNTLSLQISWRFLKTGMDLETELVSSLHPLTGTSHERISLSENGTLNLQGLMTTDAGTYSCHLAGQRKVTEITLNVTDKAFSEGPDIVKTRYTAVQLIAFILIPVVVTLIFTTVTTIRLTKCKPQSSGKGQKMESLPDTTTEPVRSHEKVDLTCHSTSSVQPLIEIRTADDVA